MFKPVFVAVMLVPALAWAARESGSTTRDSFDVPHLIQALSDPDWAVRKRASERLSLMGPSARPDVLRASRSDDPEQRARAAEILRSLPWSTPDDPHEIQQLLSAYGPSPDGGRQRIVSALADVNGGGQVLLRLLREEPNDIVRWFIVVELFGATDPKVRQAMRELDPTSDDPPTLMVSARAWFDKDRAKALALFRRAVDADQLRPSNDQGVLSIAYSQLTDAAVAQGRLEQAAELLRRQVPRDAMLTRMRNEFGQPSGVSMSRIAALLTNQLRDTGESRVPSLAALAALHRYFGPLSGFERDRRTWGRDGGRAKSSVGGNVVGLMAQLGAAPPVPLDHPFALSPDDHYAAGAFLIQHKYMSAAEIELRAALSPEAGKRIRPSTEFNASYLLSRAVAEDGRDGDAAELIDRALRTHQKHNIRLEDGTDDDLRAEIHWRRAKAAHARGDTDALNAHLRGLGQFLPGNNDVTISCIRWLKEIGRDGQARAMFEKVYKQATDELVASGQSLPKPADRNARGDGDEPATTKPAAEEPVAIGDPGALNDIAWLCARCGERLDEAVRLASEAVKSSPEMAAYVDTLAEAHYRNGNREEAIRLETRAIELTPDNEFMRQQLERYKAGKP